MSAQLSGALSSSSITTLATISSTSSGAPGEGGYQMGESIGMSTGFSSSMICRKRRRSRSPMADPGTDRFPYSPATSMEEDSEGLDTQLLVAPDYASGLLAVMRQLREKQQLCDVVVRCGSLRVAAHRLVLAAASDYFRACLTGYMVESEAKEVTLSGMDEDALEELINFAYVGKVNVTEDSVLELLVAANRLQMPQVVEQCCEYLLQRMDAYNCLSILGIANTYDCAGMRVRSEAFIHRHFEAVCLSDEFLFLPIDQLLPLLTCDAISLKSEETTFKAALRWVMHDPEARSVHVLALLKTVRLQLVPVSFIADVIHQHELVQKGGADAERLLLQAYRWHNSARADLKGELWRYVRKSAIRPVIYAIGGDDGQDDRNPYSAVTYLDTQLGQWLPGTDASDGASRARVAPLRNKRSVCGVAAFQGKVYVVGGYNGERAVESVEVFDPRANTWTMAAPISQRRCSCSCAVLDGVLYVVGGVCGPLALSEVEKYDPVTNVWTPGVPMQDGRSGCGVASLNGLLYAVGGINGAGDTVRSAEAFNPSTQQWTPLPSMHEPRRSFGVAALNGLLYACGGNDGMHDLATLEVYDPKTRRWKLLAPMRHPRMYCSVAVLDNRLYAVGGLEGTQALHAVEIYDPDTDTWSLAPKLNGKVCGCGLIVMDCIDRGEEGDEGSEGTMVVERDQGRKGLARGPASLSSSSLSSGS